LLAPGQAKQTQTTQDRDLIVGAWSLSSDELRLKPSLSHLTQEHQALLLLAYRDHLDQRALSDATGLSLRTIGYKLPDARHALAAVLDRLALL